MLLRSFNKTKLRFVAEYSQLIPKYFVPFCKSVRQLLIRGNPLNRRRTIQSTPTRLTNSDEVEDHTFFL